MARRDVEDEACLPVQVGWGEGDTERMEHRWWRITQPVPSVAFSLRGRIGAAMGPLVDVAVREFVRVVDPDGEADVASDAASVGEARALQVFRRARSGRSVVNGDLPGHDVAGDLLATAVYIARATGGRIDGPALLGVHERNTARDGSSLGFKWPGPSLLHRLLLDSRLTCGGSAKVARWPSGMAGEDHPGADLWTAVNEGSVGGFVHALDRLVTGPDELTLLYTWALLHLWRPF